MDTVMSRKLKLAIVLAVVGVLVYRFALQD